MSSTRLVPCTPYWLVAAAALCICGTSFAMSSLTNNVLGLAFAMSGSAGLVGDINNDGYVNVGDLQALVAAWGGQAGPPPSTNWNPDADINADDFVNVGDLQLLVAHWGETTDDPAAPAAVTNLAVDSPTQDSLTLTWTAPGDDGSTGTATSYDIRYRAGGAVNDSNWASATQVTGEPAPAAAGTSQNMVVSGLSASTTYYFAMKTSDEVPNTAALSNIASGTTTSGSGTGLRGEYFDEMDLTSLVLTRTDATVDFDWGNGTPDASVGYDSFSVRWTGQVQAQYSETYTFYTVSDDGVRLWVNGQQLVNNWTNHGPTEDSGTIALTAGQQYSITMEYYENGGGAVARLLWSSPSTAKAAIPQAQLFPPAVDPTAPAAVTNLETSDFQGYSIKLSWTAPGDDGSTGTATSYDIRYSTSQITEDNWANATQAHGEPAPAVAGTNQTKVVGGLLPNTIYYFAIKTSDEAPNTSAISNSPSGTTTSGGGAGKTLLTPKDFKYKGYYVIDSSSGNFDMIEWGQGLTHRYVDGQLRFLTLSYKADQTNPLVEYAPPAGGLGGTISTRTNYWPDIWTGTGLTTAGGGSLWMGLWYEEAQDRLWTTWAVNYPGDTQAQYTKSLAIRTLNSSGTVSNVQGPWGLQGIQQRRLYGGVQAIPSWFQSTYGVGPYAAGWGGCASRASVGPISLGPTFYTFAEPTGYPVGDLPTSAFKTLMDHSAATLAPDWYAQGFPTTLDRGVRNCDLRHEEGPDWQSPAPDGLARWTVTGGDSPYSTGTWIETPTKQGFILIPMFASGRVWYQASSPHHERKTAEIQVFDPNMLGQVAQGTRGVWDTYPTYRWQITDDFLPLGYGYGGSGNLSIGAPCAATYDSTTQTLYVLCLMGPNLTNHILVYEVGNGNASVSDVALAETAVSGTVSGFGTGVTGLPGNRGNTETADSVYETITEVVQGSTSQLEHKWTFNVTAGSSVVFNLKSYKTSNIESDDFVFAYSTDGTHWTNMVTVSRTTDDGNFQTYTLPGGTSGTVYVRVQDSDRVSGHTVLDTIYIDKMYFLSTP